jgi:hypothetical protein
MKVIKLAIKAQGHSLDADGQMKYAGDTYDHALDPADAYLAGILAAHVSDPEVREFVKLIDKSAPRRHRGVEDEIAWKGFTDHMPLFPIIIAAPSAPLASRLPALLTALLTLRDERSFDRTQENEQYLGAARKLIDRGFNVVVFGHTHLAKRVGVGDGIYLNTGTWADLIRFPYEQLDQERHHALQWLGGFARDMENGEINQYISHIPTYARIDLTSKGKVLHAGIHDFAEGQTLI